MRLKFNDNYISQQVYNISENLAVCSHDLYCYTAGCCLDPTSFWGLLDEICA
jgi:hypothetical protein